MSEMFYLWFLDTHNSGQHLSFLSENVSKNIFVPIQNTSRKILDMVNKIINTSLEGGIQDPSSLKTKRD